MCPAKRSSSNASPDAPEPGELLKEYQAKRDFTVTKEPSGDGSKRRSGGSLAFVVQKHAASHLHFDLRLEVDGVMKSWAVPKGPSVDTSVKRLAMEVEDHPVAYNTFEGTIPHGEYGGGTVMLWDRGTYTPDEVNAGESDNDAARRALVAGKLAFTFHGERLRGSYALVRTRRGEERAQWLLLKHRDEFADANRDIVAETMTSVDTGRRMEEIAAGRSSELKDMQDDGAIQPMEATNGKLPLPPGEYALEEEPEGTRVVAFLTNGTANLMEASRDSRELQSSTLLDKSPGVSAALLKLARSREAALVLDGFLANDELIAVDLLLDGDELLAAEPWIERRTRLEHALDPDDSAAAKRGAVRASEWVAASAEDVQRAAPELTGLTLVAKRIDSPYESNASEHWLRVNL